MMETPPTGASSPHEAGGANAQSSTHDADAFAHEAGAAPAAAGTSHGAAPGDAENPLIPSRRLQPGQAQLQGGLPTTPIIPLGTLDHASDPLDHVPQTYRRTLARMDAQARQATATEDRFRELDPRNLAQGLYVHNAAIRAYRHEDASMHSLNTAYQADNQAERASYDNRNPLARLRAPSPTGETVKRAVGATVYSRNAGMMSEVIRRDGPTQRSYQRHAEGFSLRRSRDVGDSAVREHTDRLANTDPNYHIAENPNSGGTHLRSRPDPADEDVSPNRAAFLPTGHPAEIRDGYRQTLQAAFPRNQPRADGGPEPPPLYTDDVSPPAHPASQPPPYQE